MGLRRIAFGRLSHETHALSPVPTERVDFERIHLVAGDDLASRLPPWRAEIDHPALWNAELSGLWARARWERDVALLPTLSAWTVPGGKVAKRTWDELSNELLDRLRAAGPVDGVFLVLHGAMGVEGVLDPEADLLEATREVVGPDAVIAVVFDLHAIMTRRKMDAADLVFGYKTNPHRDLFTVGWRAANALFRRLDGTLRPTIAWRALPMVVGGAPTVDVLEPMAPIFRHLRALVRSGQTVDSSLFQAQLWHDSPQVGWAVVVTTNDDADAADRIADDLADRLWSVRHHQPEALGSSVEEAVRVARGAVWRRRFGTICLADASDAVGAGSVGENTAVLAGLLEHAEGLVCYVPVRDSDAVAALWDTPIGTEVERSIGGRLAPDWYEPLAIRGRIRGRSETRLWGRVVVVDVAQVVVVLCDRAPMTVSPGFYRDVGLNPRHADLCVVKSLFLFRFYFLAYNRLSLFARTSGMTDFDIYHRVAYDQPVHPKDPVDDWRAGDAARRDAPRRPDRGGTA